MRKDIYDKRKKDKVSFKDFTNDFELILLVLSEAIGHHTMYDYNLKCQANGEEQGYNILIREEFYHALMYSVLASIQDTASYPCISEFNLFNILINKIDFNQLANSIKDNSQIIKLSSFISNLVKIFDSDNYRYYNWQNNYNCFAIISISDEINKLNNAYKLQGLIDKLNSDVSLSEKACKNVIVLMINIIFLLNLDGNSKLDGSEYSSRKEVLDRLTYILYIDRLSLNFINYGDEEDEAFKSYNNIRHAFREMVKFKIENEKINIKDEIELFRLIIEFIYAPVTKDRNYFEVERGLFEATKQLYYYIQAAPYKNKDISRKELHETILEWCGKQSKSDNMEDISLNELKATILKCFFKFNLEGKENEGIADESENYYLILRQALSMTDLEEEFKKILCDKGSRNEGVFR